MKKIIISFALVAMMVAMVSCGGRRPKAEAGVVDSVAVDRSVVDSTAVSADSVVVK